MNETTAPSVAQPPLDRRIEGVFWRGWARGILDGRRRADAPAALAAAEASLSGMLWAVARWHEDRRPREGRPVPEWVWTQKPAGFEGLIEVAGRVAGLRVAVEAAP